VLSGAILVLIVPETNPAASTAMELVTVTDVRMTQRILNSRERKCGMAHNLKKWKQSRILMLGS